MTIYNSTASYEQPVSASSDWLHYVIHQYWDNNSHPLMRDWPLLESGPWRMIGLILSYYVFAKKIGPALMANRKPFELRKPMLAYNFLMVAINGYFFIQSLYWLNFGSALWVYEYPDQNHNPPETVAQIRSFYLYYLTKYIDLLDTMFFVLRKKENQITALHLWHHSSVPIFLWVIVKACPTIPPILLFASLNCMVHVIMYLYYALAALGPMMQRYLWWKRYLTQLQLMQFVILGIYYVHFAQRQVDYPLGWMIFEMSQVPIYLVLFTRFYFKSYKAKRA